MKEKNIIEKLLQLPEEKLDKIIEKLAQDYKDTNELIDLLDQLSTNCRKEKIATFKVVLKAHLKYGNIDNDCSCEKIGDK